MSIELIVRENGKEVKILDAQIDILTDEGLGMIVREMVKALEKALNKEIL